MTQIKQKLLLLSMLLLFCSAVQAREELQPLLLPPADVAPYTLKIPIQASNEGKITALIKLQAEEWQSDKMVFVSLHQEGNRYVLASKYYDHRMQGLYLSHTVSQQQLQSGGEYFLSLVNYSYQQKVTGEVRLNYPVAGESLAMRTSGALPNLTVNAIELDEHCKVQVKLQNTGPGTVPTWMWKKRMPKLVLYKDDREWENRDIRYFDYGKGLSPAGGEALYGTGLKLIGSARVKVVLDSENILSEGNESDNELAVVLVCK